MSKAIPTNTEILALLDKQPDKVASFANQLFSSDCFAEPELIMVAKKLVKGTSADFRSHLWESFGRAIRSQESRCHADWFQLARTRLLENEISAEEFSAIRDFLSDLRIFSPNLDKDSLTAHDSEWDWYVGINHLARTVEKSNLDDCIQILTDASLSESFLVRESVVEALGILATRSNLNSHDLMPFRLQFDLIVSLISNDSNQFVRQSLKTVLPLLDVDTQL
jgi:hypothetical protein